MKFCFINEIFPYKKDGELIITGGGESHGFFLAKELVNRGHEVVAITGKWNDSPSFEIIDGIEFYRYPSLVPFYNQKALNMIRNYAITAFPLFKLFFKICKENRPDFVISNLTPSLFEAMFLSKLKRMRYVITVHDLYGIRDISKYNRIDFSFLPNIVGNFYLWHYRFLISQADFIETVSNYSMTQLSCIIPKHKIFVSGNGVDLEKYQYTEDKQNLIVVMGRLISYKNVDRAIKIFIRLKIKFPDVKLIIIGEGPQRSKLMSSTKNKEDIIFTGFLPETKKIETLRRAKILLSCSDLEGFSMGPIEAMACGAVPVVSDIPAHGEIFDNNETIFNNSLDAVEIIGNLLTDESLRIKIAKKNRNVVESRYNWELVCDRFLRSIK
ncbi:MAG: glycosyltransferase family 4 protein [Candidatus Methanoperedens sp.]